MKPKIKIPVSEPYLGKEELDNVVKAVKSGWISSLGEFITKFEHNFANYCGMKYGIATSNGTTALHLALASLGIKAGDEVIVPSLTFIATANAVFYCNAKPVFVDSNLSNWCIDPEKIEKKITKKTKAIIPVHLYGHPCDMDPILKIAKKYNLYVIEDCAEAHGAEYKGKKIGSMGDISCFSFYGNKIMTTGEGGICLTNNKKLAEKMKLLRDVGMDLKRRYWHNVIGFNYRITNLQAAVGVAQTKKIDYFIGQKRKIAKWYNQGLENLEKKGLIDLHPEESWAKCVYWMYSILIKDKGGKTRNKLIEKLKKTGIDTRPFFYPIHILPPYKNNQKLPIAEKLSKTGINLPSAVTLTEKDVKIVTRTINSFFN